MKPWNRHEITNLEEKTNQTRPKESRSRTYVPSSKLSSLLMLESQKRLIFKPKKKNFLSLKGNQIANESTYPCFPISQDQLAADKDETHNDPLPPNYEFTCITFSRDKLYMPNNTLLLFIPADCKVTTETGRELIQTNRLIYTDIQNENPENLEVGNVLVIKYEDNYVFNLIVKQSFDSKPYHKDIIAALWAFKYAMEELKIESISVSRVGNGLNQIFWPTIEKEFRELFGQGNYKITVCYGEIETPAEEDRKRIISEYHSSVTGGHKGSTKTYE